MAGGAKFERMLLIVRGRDKPDLLITRHFDSNLRASVPIDSGLIATKELLKYNNIIYSSTATIALILTVPYQPLQA